MSIAASIAEGNGRFTKPDRKNFFGIARGSVQGWVPLLELAVRQGLMKSERHKQLEDDPEEVARMLSGLIQGLDKREVQGGRLRSTDRPSLPSGGGELPTLDP